MIIDGFVSRSWCWIMLNQSIFTLSYHMTQGRLSHQVCASPGCAARRCRRRAGRSGKTMKMWSASPWRPGVMVVRIALSFWCFTVLPRFTRFNPFYHVLPIFFVSPGVSEFQWWVTCNWGDQLRLGLGSLGLQRRRDQTKGHEGRRDLADLADWLRSAKNKRNMKKPWIHHDSSERPA